MTPIYFSAILKTENDEFLEEGLACIHGQSDDVDFKNEFVPLLKIGATVKICRISDGEEQEVLVGTVYLSSGKLLRISCTSAATLTSVKRVFTVNTSIFTEIAFYRQSRFFSFKKAEIFTGTVYFVSPNVIKFLSMEPLEVGQKLIFDVEEPINLRKVVVEVRKKNVFGSAATGYVCKITACPPSGQESISTYCAAFKQL